MLIMELTNDESTERVCKLLELYLSSTIELLEKVDDIDTGYNRLEYVSDVINGNKDIDDCCEEIFENIEGDYRK